MNLKNLINSALDVVLPRRCPVCDATLGGDERFLCRRCLAALPRTRLEETEFNAMEQLFAGKVPVERATALFFYEKGSPFAAIIHDIKYNNMAPMGVWMGAYAVRMMQASGFFDGIDVVIPVPLHADKLAQRGYNQAERIAHGIAQETGAAIGKHIVATRPHSTQTQKGAYERWLNTRDTVAATPRAATELQGKHVLLVDDVITTGATIIACAEALAAIPGITISIFTLAAARLE